MEDPSSFEEGRAPGPFIGVTGLITQQPIRKAQTVRDSTVGILKIDIGKPRRSSGSSVEFLSPCDRNQAEPTSPQPSVDRLSVTFAPEERSVCSDSSVRFSTSSPAQTTQTTAMDKVHFSREPTVTDGEEEEDDDYSASVSAIMQRRASVRRPSRRRSRRPSSPFSPDADSGQSGARRRSSVFTTSSGDTGISMDDGTTQEQIYENLRLHKEVLSSVKQQPWNMRRKLRLVQQAKAYVRRHEGELQERLAQSKTTRDVLARFNILRVKLWQYLKRELANLTNVLIPWELRIKEIESHFGSVVASYFTFLRWLFWVNLVLAVLLSLFVIMPEMLTADRKSGGELKAMLPEEVDKSTNLMTLWNFEGVLKYSPIFYGYYTNRDDTTKGYRLPFAYFMTGLAVYIYSFVATLRRMAENSRMSKLSEKDDECVFTWKLLSGWDYMIGNAETAHNRVASIILGFKEALLEEAEKKKDARNWKVIALRVLVNFTVLILLASSAYAVVEVVQRSKKADETWWRKNEITVVLSLISFVFPLLFEALGLMESYHPRKQLRIQLARIMVLNLLNLYTLIFALFGKINDMTIQLQLLKNSTAVPESSTRPSFTPEGSFTRGVNVITSTFLATSDLSASSSQCFDVQVPCGAITSTPSPPINITTTLVAALLFANATSDSRLFENITSLFANSSLISTTSFLGLINNSSFALPSTLSMTPDELLTFLNMSSLSPNYTESTTYDGFDEATNENEYDRFDFSNFSSSPFFTYPTSEDIVSEDYANDSSVNATIYGGDDEWNATFSTDSYDVSSQSIQDTSTETSTEVDINSTLMTYLTTITNQIRNQSGDVTEDDWRTVLSEVMTMLSSPSEPDEEVCYERRCTDYTQEFTTDAMSSQQPEDPNGTSYTGSGSGGTVTSSDDAYLQRAMPASAMVDIETRRKLRKLCWETMFGQELVKLTIFDLVITIFSTLLVDFFRAIFVRVMNNFWCWDLEKQFPQYGDFKIAENILHLVNNQGMVWMGMFFSPALPLLNLVKLGILMYLRSWAVLTCNVPHEIVFRASRSNNFYFALLLTMLFLCVLPVGYAVVWVEPSWHCGPFSNYERIYHMILYLSLQTQLRRERTEERRKMFQLVDKRRRTGSILDSADTPFTRWRKILPVMPSHKALPGEEGSGKEADTAVNGTLKPDSNRNEMLARLMKRALRKSSATSDEESVLIGDGDGTDIEQHDSLPDDTVLAKLAKSKTRRQSVVEAVKKQTEPSKKENNNAKNVRKTAESSHKTGDSTQKSSDAQTPQGEVQRKTGETSVKKLESSKKSEERSTKKTSEPALVSESSVKKRADHPRHHYSSHNRRTSTRSKSPSTSSVKERGADSQNSNWSDNIPVIRISKTDSADFDLHMRAEPQQPTKSSSSDTIIDIGPLKSTGAVSKFPDAQRRNDQTSRKKLARALLQEARRWRSDEERGTNSEQVAMIEVKPRDLATPEGASSEERPEVYI